MQAPTFDEVYLFLKQIFVAADLSAELGIITLIYLERLLYRTHITLHGINVFRAILSALMLASKVWDDQAVWNVDFHTIFSDLKLNDLNQLERWLLGKINFDVSVKRNVFARYWFEVREVAEKLWGVRMSAMASNMRLNASTANMLKSNSNVHKKEGKSITQLNKSQHDFSDSNNHPVPVLPKPLTEATLKNVIHVSTTFSQTKLRENFKDQLGVGSDKDSNGSKSANKLNISKAATKSGNSISEGKSSKQISEGTQVKNIPSTSGDFGWGGSNLRKTKSTDFYKPTVPNASVL